MEFIRSSILKNYTTATEPKKIDLPVNPLSHVIISMDGYNVTDEATLAEMLAFINSVQVTHSGRTIVNLQSEDLYSQNCYLFRRRPVLEGKVATDNQRRVLSLIVPFGRKLYDPSECYPATKKGELTLTLDTTVPTASLDNSQLNIETVELPGATPGRYLKSNMSVIQAPSATGDRDWDLPIGNDLVAILLRMTTFSAASSHSYGVDGVTILVDNKEYLYSFARTQCLVGEMINRLDMQHGTIAAQGALLPQDSVFVDFDPNSDDAYLLKTAGKSRVHAILNMGVAEATYGTILELVNV